MIKLRLMFFLMVWSIGMHSQSYIRAGYKSIGLIKAGTFGSYTHFKFRKLYIIQTDTTVFLNLSVPISYSNTRPEVNLTIADTKFLKTSLTNAISDMNKAKDLEDFEYKICPTNDFCMHISKEKEWNLGWEFKNQVPEVYETTSIDHLNAMVKYIQQFLSDHGD